MKNVLVDSSVWIDYFRGKKSAEILNSLIDDNLVCINDLILTEIIPYLRVQKENTLIDILYAVKNISLDIGWNEIIAMQTKCLKRGINKIGIPDLIILQNIIQNDFQIFSFDKHFSLMKSCFKFDLY